MLDQVRLIGEVSEIDPGSRANFESHARECLRWGKPVPDVLSELAAAGLITMPEKPDPEPPIPKPFIAVCACCGRGKAWGLKCPSCGGVSAIDAETGKII